MLSALQILLPVFGLVFAGYACRRRGVLGPTCASELNRFVVWLALPALLFNSMAHATWEQLYQPAFVGAFGLACAAVFAIVLVIRLMQGGHLADASVGAIAAAYPNTGYIGFPLCLLVFGPASLAPTTIATLLVVCVLFSIAIVLIEVGVQSERRPLKLAFKLVRSLLRNPLIVAPIAGSLVALSGLTLPVSVDTFLKLLSGAASPCALVSLGLFLAQERPNSGVARDTVWLTGVKLVVQPLLTWWLAARVFSLSPSLVGMAVLLSALPTGTGPYMLAEYYVRDARLTSQVILWSTVGSLATLSVLLQFIG